MNVYNNFQKDCRTQKWIPTFSLSYFYFRLYLNSNSNIIIRVYVFLYEFVSRFRPFYLAKSQEVMYMITLLSLVIFI